MHHGPPAARVTIAPAVPGDPETILHYVDPWRTRLLACLAAPLILGPGSATAVVPDGSGVGAASGSAPAVIVGEVSNVSGTPLAGVSVLATVQHLYASGDSELDGNGYEQFTGADGGYRLEIPTEGIAAFVTVVFAELDGDGNATGNDATRAVVLDPGETVTLDQTLAGASGPDDAGAPPAGTIAGTVTLTSGEPVPGASVLATVEGGTGYEALTSADGTYSLQLGVPAPGTGVTVVFAELDGDGNATGNDATRAVVLDPGETVTLDQTLAGASGPDDAGAPPANGGTATEPEAGIGSDSGPGTVPHDATLLAYLPLDGATPSEAARGLETERIGSLEAIDGRYGGGILFPGESFLFMPLDIDFTAHPQITVSAWVLVDERREASSYRNGGHILGTGHGNSGTPALRFNNAKIRADGGKVSVINHAAGSLPVGEWVHVAAVWDYEARTIRVHVGDVVETRTGIDGMDPFELTANDRNQALLDHPTDPEREPTRYVLVGASTLGGNRSLGLAGLDDLRIYAGALTSDEIAAIRTSANEPAPLGEVAPPPPGPDPTEETGEDGPTGTRYVDWRLGDEYELSEVSGTESTHLDADFRSEAIHRISVDQVAGTQDRPCRVEIVSVAGDTRTIESRPCWIPVDVGPPSLIVDLASDTPINSLQVCQNRKRNERVKGLRAWGKKVQVDEATGAIDFREVNAAEDDLPNCGEWEEFVSCPSGLVASGVHAHFTRVRKTNMEQLVGLQLVCRRVVAVPEE